MSSLNRYINNTSLTNAAEHLSISNKRTEPRHTRTNSVIANNAIANKVIANKVIANNVIANKVIKSHGITKTNANTNSVRYRTFKTGTKFITDNCLVNRGYFVKMISKGLDETNKGKTTETGSKVYLVKDNMLPNKKYIVKETQYFKPGHTKEDWLNQRKSLKIENQKFKILHEGMLYNIVINSLVENRITPYVIMGYDIRDCDEQNKIFLINETSNDINVAETLHDEPLSLLKFINEYCTHHHFKIVLLHILFQITYTLLCFEKINLQHSDLHIGNILVFTRPKNILNKEYSYDSDILKLLYYFKYGNARIDEFLLLDIGIDIRIYDFDKSIKQKSETKIHNLNIEAFPEDYDAINLTKARTNHKFINNQDLVYVIINLYDILKNKYEEYKNKSLCEYLFLLQKYLNTDELNKNFFGKEIITENQFVLYYSKPELLSPNIKNKIEKIISFFTEGKCKSNDRSNTSSSIQIFYIKLKKFKEQRYKDYFKSPLLFLKEIINLLQQTDLYKSKELSTRKQYSRLENFYTIDSFDVTNLFK